MPTAASLLARMLGTIRAPRDTLEAVARTPRWAGVLAVAFLAAASMTALVLETEVGQLALLDQLERTATALRLPVDDAQYAALQRTSERGVAFAVVTSLVSGPLLAVGLSGVRAGAFRAATGGRATYRQVLAIVAHASVILASRRVVATMTGGEQAGPQAPARFRPKLPEWPCRCSFARAIGTINTKYRKSSHLLRDYRRLWATFWGRHLWGRGDFVCSSGNVTDEVIAEHIRVQGGELPNDDRFQVSDERACMSGAARLFSRPRIPRLQARVV